MSAPAQLTSPGGPALSYRSATAARLRSLADSDRIIAVILMLLSLSAVTGLATITVFIFKEGVPLIVSVGFREFIFSSNWYPLEKPPEFGILPMIVGSLAVTLGAMIIGVTLGLG